MFVARSIAADHKDLIHDVSYDFHGRRMATCSSDQSVKVSYLEVYKGLLMLAVAVTASILTLAMLSPNLTHHWIFRLLIRTTCWHMLRYIVYLVGCLFWCLNNSGLA